MYTVQSNNNYAVESFNVRTQNRIRKNSRFPVCTATLVNVHTYKPLLYQSHYFQIKPEGAAVLGYFF